MKTAKLYSRFTTLFLFLLFGIAIGAKTGGLDTFRFTLFLAVLGIISFFHVKRMRKRFARCQSVVIEQHP